VYLIVCVVTFVYVVSFVGRDDSLLVYALLFVCGFEFYVLVSLLFIVLVLVLVCYLLSLFVGVLHVSLLVGIVFAVVGLSRL